MLYTRSALLRLTPLLAGFVLVFAFVGTVFLNTAQAAVIGSQTDSSTAIRVAGSGGSFNLTLPTLNGTLKSFDMYVGASGCKYNDAGSCGRDVEGTYTALVVRIQCSSGSMTGGNASGYFIADYPTGSGSGEVPRSNSTWPTPNLVHFIWVNGSASGWWDQSGSGDPVFTSCVPTAYVAVVGADMSSTHPFTSFHSLGDSGGVSYFVGYDTTGVVVDVSTRIDSVTPAPDSTVATSTTFAVGVDGYLNPADFSMNAVENFFGAGEEVQLKIEPISDYDVQQSVAHTQTFTWPITTSGAISVSTTTSVLATGIYSFKAEIHEYAFDVFGFRFGYQVQAVLNGQFTVSTSTDAERALAKELQRLNIFFGNASTTSDVAVGACAIVDFFTASTTLPCLGQMIWPSGAAAGQVGSDLYNGLLQRVPFGYATRFMTLLASTTIAVEPPALTYTFGSSSPVALQGKTYSVQIWDALGSTSPILLAKSDDGENKNIWDIVMPYWNTVVALAVLLAILSDLFGFEMLVDKTQEERRYGALKPREKGIADRAKHGNKHGANSGMGTFK